MCSDNTCPSKTICYRHKASGTIQNHYQYYAQFDRKNKDKCDYFLEKHENLQS